MNSRQRRIAVFNDTLFACLNDPYLAEVSNTCIAHTKILPESCGLHPGSPRFEKDCDIAVSAKRTLEAAESYIGQGKVCVLNFASSINPGGGVTTGSGAQEECLCRCSTLYPSLNDRKCWELFYLPHRRSLNPLYNDDCIYTDNVCVFKADTVWPEWKQRDAYFSCDVITCAAPNMTEAQEEGISCSEQQLKELFRKRCTRILEIAADQQADVLILGAFGCGAFGNDPAVAAQAMRDAVQPYRKYFRQIEFAVYCPPGHPENYEVFRAVFGK